MGWMLLALLTLPPAAGCSTPDSIRFAPDVPFAMPAIALPVIPKGVYSLEAYGAVEGGEVPATGAIERAIADAASHGGGRVLVPRGIWLTGGIRLENGIDLHLEEGAVLRFSRRFEDYLPPVFSRHEDIECYKHAAFIYANGSSDIAITGRGVLDGNGEPWWGLKQSGAAEEMLLRKMAADGVPVEQRVFDGNGGRILRPAFFQPMNCRRVLVEGVTFRFGAFWTITPTYCEDVVVRNVSVVTAGARGTVPNGDGVDISSCTRVLIEGCAFDTGDDCICLKSGRDQDGLRVNRPTENVVIRDCTGNNGHGGIVIGSETSGGIRNVLATNCAFSGTDRMVRLKTARGRGGVVENAWFRGLRGDSIRLEAIHLNMLYESTRFPARPVDASTPAIRNIHFALVRCSSGRSRSVEILGLPERPVENITFDGVSLSTRLGFGAVDAKNVSVTDADVSAAEGAPFSLLDCDGILLNRVGPLRARGPVVDVQGARSASICLSRSTLPSDVEAVRLGADVPPGAVRIDDPVDRSLPWSDRIARTFLARHPGGVTYDTASPDRRWNYEQGLMLVSLLRMAEHRGDDTYRRFVRLNLDRYVDSAGSIATYDRESYNLDNIAPGRALLALSGGSADPKYRRAADTLRRQLAEQPRTAEGGFWHKKIYPGQMWLDGLFMAGPFYLRYAIATGEQGAFDDIAKQFLLADRHLRDGRTGLLYHGWDESRRQAWADPSTGRSPNFWSRSMGWYLAGLVDVLQDFPRNHPARDSLVGVFRSLARAVRSMQDPASGVWYQVTDLRKRAGNYREASGSCMFAYAFARGARLSLLDSSYLASARRAFEGITREFVTVDDRGLVNLHDVCRSAGLGGKPYRDGSFEYYVGEPRRTNDMKGVGPWLLAAIELEKAGTGLPERGR
jgi:unsaturated rhamnogalacturonyl hydrolase